MTYKHEIHCDECPESHERVMNQSVVPDGWLVVLCQVGNGVTVYRHLCVECAKKLQLVTDSLEKQKQEIRDQSGEFE